MPSHTKHFACFLPHIDTSGGQDLVLSPWFLIQWHLTAHQKWCTKSGLPSEIESLTFAFLLLAKAEYVWVLLLSQSLLWLNAADTTVTRWHYGSQSFSCSARAGKSYLSNSFSFLTGGTQNLWSCPAFSQVFFSSSISRNRKLLIIPEIIAGVAQFLITQHHVRGFIHKDTQRKQTNKLQQNCIVIPLSMYHNTKPQVNYLLDWL